MLDLFRLVGGIDIQNEGLTSNAYILQGQGVPGGDSSVQDAAPVGSTYNRTDSANNNLQVYYKVALNNNANDWRVLADKTYVDSAVNGISWREPAIVRSTATTLPTGTAGSPIVVDTISITDGQRVLFSALTANPNVYIYNQAAGTFTQDANLATDGDALFIVDGNSKGNRWTFNGTSWVLFGAETDVSEITFIDTFIGKPLVGNNTPDYASTNVVTDGQSLATAISGIDAALGTGNITNTGGNYSIASDLAFKTEGATITDAIDQLNAAIGSRTYTASDALFPLQSGGGTVAADLDKLNVAVHDVIVGGLEIADSVATTPETFTTVDSIDLSLATEVTWMIQVRETTATANRRSSQVHAITDGTNIDFTRYAELTLGSGVAGYGIQVIVDSGAIKLQAKATNGYDYVVKRVSISSF